MLINIYLDESNNAFDGFSGGFSIGAMYCPQTSLEEIKQDIKDIKSRNGIKIYQELKWTKISPSTTSLYCDFLKYFSQNENIRYLGFLTKLNTEHSIVYPQHRRDIIRVTLMVINGIITMLGLDNKYHIIADFDDAYGHKIGTIIKDRMNQNIPGLITEYTHVDSRKSAMIQMADVINGTLLVNNNKEIVNKGKRELYNYVYQNYLEDVNKSLLGALNGCEQEEVNEERIFSMLRTAKPKFAAIPLMRVEKESGNE